VENILRDCPVLGSFLQTTAVASATIQLSCKHTKQKMFGRDKKM
jgi:hypothetical protein